MDKKIKKIIKAKEIQESLAICVRMINKLKQKQTKNEQLKN